MIDLFDLLDDKPAGTESVWEKILYVAPYMSASFCQLLMDRETTWSDWGGGWSDHSRGQCSYTAQGFWLGRNPETGSRPDLTWRQIQAAFEDRRDALDHAVWAELETLWAAYKDAWDAYEADPRPWHARERAAIDHTWATALHQFETVFNLNDKEVSV